MEQVSDRIASLYEGVERKYRGTLPVGDPRLSSPPIHRGDPLIPDSLAGFGAEAERTFYTLNPQGGASVTTGPGYDPAYVASPWSGTDVGGSPSSRRAGGAGGLEGGNFCDEGVLIGRCVIQQPVRFEGDYTISGAGTVPVTRVQECNCNTAACTCKISFGDFLPDHADLTWARLTLEVERPGVTISAQEQVVTSALVDGRTFGGQCDPPRTCGVSKDAMVCPEECGSYHTCVGNAEVTAQALDGYVEVSVTSGRTLFLGGQLRGTRSQRPCHTTGRVCDNGRAGYQARRRAPLHHARIQPHNHRVPSRQHCGWERCIKPHPVVGCAPHQHKRKRICDLPQGTSPPVIAIFYLCSVSLRMISPRLIFGLW